MVIFGASGHGKVVADIIKLENKFSIDCFLDDAEKGDSFYGFPLYLREGYFQEIKNLFIAIGDNRIRKKIHGEFNVNFPSIKHPSAILSNSVTIGEGTCFMANSTVNADTKIGKQCIVNTSASIDHDCEIGDYVHVSPNASLAGNVSVGELSHIGIGASIIQGINIGKNVMIGAGSVIINNIPDHSIVIGVPGKIIKKNE